MTRSLTFWYDFASPYSYPAAARIAAAARTAGMAVIWSPFLLGPIFAAQGWSDTPFKIIPAKGAYMMRDLARECARLALPWREPSAFPRKSVLAARVALALEPDQTAVAGFSRAVFHANFVEDRDIADPIVLRGCLEQANLPVETLDMAPSMKDRLRSRTAAASAAGLFGAPTFMVGTEMFWGNDRLEQALAWLDPRA